jgi:hypothetical protein
MSYSSQNGEPGRTQEGPTQPVFPSFIEPPVSTPADVSSRPAFPQADVRFEPSTGPSLPRWESGDPYAAPTHIAEPTEYYASRAAPAAAPGAPPRPAPASLAHDAVAEEDTVAVFVRLTSTERIWIGRFENMQQAEQRAKEIVHALNRPEPGKWARFGNRLIRPEAVVSVELCQRHPT